MGVILDTTVLIEAERGRFDMPGFLESLGDEGVALAIAAARAGKTPVVIADHADRTGNSTHVLEALIRQ